MRTVAPCRRHRRPPATVERASTQAIAFLGFGLILAKVFVVTVNGVKISTFVAVFSVCSSMAFLLCGRCSARRRRAPPQAAAAATPLCGTLSSSTSLRAARRPSTTVAQSCSGCACLSCSASLSAWRARFARGRWGARSRRAATTTSTGECLWRLDTPLRSPPHGAPQAAVGRRADAEAAAAVDPGIGAGRAFCCAVVCPGWRGAKRRPAAAAGCAHRESGKARGDDADAGSARTDTGDTRTHDQPEREWGDLLQ